MVEAAHEALDRWGYGMASVRFICGTQALHRELEERLSLFVGADEQGEPFLQLAVQRLRPADEAHGRHPVPPPLERLVGGRDDGRVVGQTQVVVGAEVQHLAAWSTNSLPTLGRA